MESDCLVFWVPQTVYFVEATVFFTTEPGIYKTPQNGEREDRVPGGDLYHLNKSYGCFLGKLRNLQ